MKGQKKNIFVITLILMLLFTAVIKGTVGSEDDPLISLSYVENVIMPYIDEVAGENDGFTVVEVEKGSSIEFHAGAEIILRSGEGVIVIPKSAGGGLTDVTSGVDKATGTVAEANHLLICPRSDGRRIKANSKLYIMVRGSYEIIQG